MTRWSIRFASAPVVAGVLSYAPWLALLGVLSYLSWFMTDDAFIAFRYVRNFMEGYGLVFNPGERVEGYSSFLWVLELAAIWKIFGLPPEDVAQWLSVGYTAGVIALLLWWVRRDATLRNRGLAGWMALGLVCGSATFAAWTSGGGLETRQFTFFVMAAIVALSVHTGSRWGLLAASFGLAGASLTRPEGILIAACCFGWFCLSRTLADRRRSDASPGSAPHPDSIAWRRLVAWIDWREIACLVTPFLIVVVAHLAFRLTYYGDWLPNTYYAKTARPWWEAGFLYYLGAAVNTGLYLLVPLAFLALCVRWRSRRDIAYALPLLCIFVHVLGVMRIGGDHFEYRPLDFYWPALAVPAAAAILDLGSRLAGSRLLSRFPPHSPGPAAILWSVAIFVPVLLYCQAIQFQLALIGSRTDSHISAKALEVNEENAKWLLHVPGMALLLSVRNQSSRLASRGIGTSVSEQRWFASDSISKWGPYKNMERGIVPPEFVAIGRSIGIPFYYIPDVVVIDYYGLTDRVIGRNPHDTPNRVRRMAHDRSPPPGYLTSRGSNVILHHSTNSATRALEIAPYALKVGTDLWMPFEGVYSFRDSIIDRFSEYPLLARKDLRANIDFKDLLIRKNSPIISADYDVWLIDNWVLYRKVGCLNENGASDRFPRALAKHRFHFLHVFPININDLPYSPNNSGFSNLDFYFEDHGYNLDGICIAARRLPDYAIAAIETGEFDIHGGRRIWEGRWDFLAQDP